MFFIETEILQYAGLFFAVAKISNTCNKKNIILFKKWPVVVYKRKHE